MVNRFHLFCFTLFLLLTQVTSSISQPLSPQWALQIGGAGDDRGLKVMADPVGNVYFAGVFEKEIVIHSNGGFDSLAGYGYEDIFFSKLNRNGQVVWTKHIGGKGSDAPTDIMINSTGDVFLSGLFQDSLFFSTCDTLIAEDFIDSFIAKFDSLGNLMWINQISGRGTQQCLSMFTDMMGNLLSCGFYSHSIVFPGENSTVNFSQNNYDGFVALWSSEGDLIWLKTLNNNGEIVIKDIIVDQQNGYYIAGNFTDTVYIDNQTFIISEGKTDGFIMKMSNSGEIIWSESFGGVHDDNVKRITLGGDNKMIVAGEFKGELVHKGNVILTAEGGDDIFHLTFNKHGKLQNHKKHGQEMNDFVFDAWLPVGQKILMATDLKTVNAHQNTKLASYEISGNMSEVFLLGDDYNPKVLSAVMPDINQIYYTGSFSGTVSFNNIELTSVGNEDFFLLKIGLDNDSDQMPSPDSTYDNLNFSQILLDDKPVFESSVIFPPYDTSGLFFNFPNPFRDKTQIIYSLAETCDVTITIMDIKGNIIKEWHTSNQSPGNYSVIFNGKG
ncbi:MAG: hypothetical protein K0B08_01670, partial [Bacteroidales bacterium]|nr:hypothetical protein [Bacteroidales bacterium]